MREFVRGAVYTLPIDKATQEVILEWLRWLFFVALSAIVTAVLEVLADVEPTTTVAVLTIALRSADKWIYNHRKEAPRPKNATTKGLIF